jgi:LSD1 subclass zinc finger protein
MSTVRLRRLRSDHEKLRDYVRRHPRVKLVRAEGDPPESYQVEYRLRSLRMVNGDLTEVISHLVEIILPGSYPRLPPQCRMLTPIFHPNIAPHAICIGDHWTAGESLSSIVARIGEMISYQSYNTKSPLNGEAARWVTENVDQLPLDGVSMDVEDKPDAAVPAARPAARVSASRATPPPVKSAVAEEQKVVVVCTNCQTKLRAPAAARGKRIRCPRCQTLNTVSEH